MAFAKKFRLKEKSYNRLFGIFVGVENFPNSNNQIKGLLHANEDAENLCAFFVKDGLLKNRMDELCLMTDEAYLDKIQIDKSVEISVATRANILGRLTKVLKIAKPDDLILIYFSSHGEIDYGDYFFIPSDGALDNLLGTGVSSNTIIQALGKGSSRGVKVLMIVDTCYAGAISFDISKYKGEFSCILSSSPIEYSYEFYNIEHGIFTHFLIEGLKGKAKKNGIVTLVNLYDYVYKQVQKETGKKQNPLMIGTMKYDFSLIN